LPTVDIIPKYVIGSSLVGQFGIIDHPGILYGHGRIGHSGVDHPEGLSGKERRDRRHCRIPGLTGMNFHLVARISALQQEQQTGGRVA
jgi:hypothetical protein